MRYEGNKVVITESELRWLVNESAKNALLTEVGNWAGVKNAWNGLANGKFNVKNSFQTGKQSRTFQKYYNNAQKSITGMQQVLNNSNQSDLASKLQQVNAQLQQAANGFQQRAAQASGRQQQTAPNANNNVNPNANANANNGANTNVNSNGRSTNTNTNVNNGANVNRNANTNVNNGTNTNVNSNGGSTNTNTNTNTNANVNANANNSANTSAGATPGLATKMGQGIGKAGAAMRNFAKGVRNGYNNNKVNINNQNSETNQEVNPANPNTYVPAEYQQEKNKQDTQGGYGYNSSPFGGYDETQQAQQGGGAQQNGKIQWPDAGDDYEAPKPKMSMFNQAYNNVLNGQQAQQGGGTQQNGKIQWPDAGDDYEAPKPKMQMFNQAYNDALNGQQTQQGGGAQQNGKVQWPDAGDDYEAPKPKMSMFNQAYNDVLNRQQKPTETDYARQMMNNNYGDEGYGDVNQPTYAGHGMQPDPEAVKNAEEQNNDLNQAFNGLTRDYDKIYNSVTPRKVMPESRRIVTVTPNYIRRLVTETLNILMNEDGGAAGGGGATNAAGVMQGGGTNPGAGQYDVPAFGGKTNKKKADGFGEPIMRQAHNLGDVTQAKVNQVDMGPALKRKRGGSIAMNRQK